MILAKSVFHVFVSWRSGSHLTLTNKGEDLVVRMTVFGGGGVTNGNTAAADAFADETHAFADKMLDHFLGFRLLGEERKEAAEAETREVGEAKKFCQFFFDAS